MITFTKIPSASIDLATGKTTGLPSKPVEPTIGAMPIKEFHSQVMGLANSKTPIEKVHSAIDQHPDIQDKRKAKSMASAVYKIMGRE